MAQSHEHDTHAQSAQNGNPQDVDMTPGIYALCRSQFDRAQDLASAAFDSAERLQQLTLQGVRHGLSQQFGLLQEVTLRNAQTLTTPRFDLMRATIDRMVDLQRDAARTMVDAQRRIFDAASASAQGTGQFFEQAGAITRDARGNVEEGRGSTADLMTQAIEQWQGYMRHMLDLAERQTRQAGEQQQRLVMTLDQASGRATDEMKEQGRRAESGAAQAIQSGSQAAGAMTGAVASTAGNAGGKRGAGAPGQRETA